MTGTLLIVGESAAARSQICQVVQPLNFSIEQVADAEAALVSVADRDLALVILSVESSGLEGAGIVRDLLRACRAPVIVVSNCFVEDECVNALIWGADDYLTQPLLPRELAARIGSVLRRAGQHGSSKTQNGFSDFGRLRIDYDSRQVFVGPKLVELRSKEFDLLAYLARNPMKVFSREDLLRAVWSSSSEWQDPSTITEHARRIRLRLAREGISHAVIGSVRSAGYRFDPHSCGWEFAEAG